MSYDFDMDPPPVVLDSEAAKPKQCSKCVCLEMNQQGDGCVCGITAKPVNTDVYVYCRFWTSSYNDYEQHKDKYKQKE